MKTLMLINENGVADNDKDSLRRILGEDIDLGNRKTVYFATIQDSNRDLLPSLVFTSKTDAEFFFSYALSEQNKSGNKLLVFTTLPNNALKKFNGRVFTYRVNLRTLAIRVSQVFSIQDYGMYTNRLFEFECVKVVDGAIGPEYKTMVATSLPPETVYNIYYGIIKIDVTKTELETFYNNYFIENARRFPVVLPPPYSEIETDQGYFHGANQEVRTVIDKYLVKNKLPRFDQPLGYLLWRAIDAACLIDFLKDGAYFEMTGMSRQHSEMSLLEDGKTGLSFIYPWKADEKKFIKKWRKEFFFPGTAIGGDNNIVDAVIGEMKNVIEGIEIQVRDAEINVNLPRKMNSEMPEHYWSEFDLPAVKDKAINVIVKKIEQLNKWIGNTNDTSASLIDSRVLEKKNTEDKPNTDDIRAIAAFSNLYWKYPFANQAHRTSWLDFMRNVIDTDSTLETLQLIEKELNEKIEVNDGFYGYGKNYSREQISFLRFALPAGGKLKAKHNNLLNQGKLNNNYILR